MAVDEAQIRREVFSRVHNVSVREEWLTPAGRQRSAPMYEATIGNAFLRLDKVVKGTDLATVRAKAESQLSKWAEQEARDRIAVATNVASARAADQVAALRRILHDTLAVDDRINWDALHDRSEFPPFNAPRGEPAPSKTLSPAKPWLSWLRSGARSRWEQSCADLEAEYQRGLEVLHQRNAAVLTAAREEYERRRHAFEIAKSQRNASIFEYKRRFEAGESEGIEEYVRSVFERSSYPAGFYVEHQLAFDAASQTIVVDLRVPAIADIPDIVDYRLGGRDKPPSPIRLKKKELEDLYDDAVQQSVLRTIHEIFESVYTPHVQAAVVNGWVTAVSRTTGHEETTCIISVSAERDPFMRINLARVDPAACIKSLKGLVAGPLSALAPVKPILKLDRSDGRFVASRDVLDDLDVTANLAEMPWEDFEQLVRELFGKMFSSADSEVRVTQASRDGGVDAVAFDPDPIRGGKFVIQAKRYNKVVPVSATRDLYGTMIAEGAVKGILVTTAHYGRDSREFAKDKPIALIDGPELVYLLEQHGHRVRIQTKSPRGRG